MASAEGHLAARSGRGAGKTLVATVTAALLDQIEEGKYKPGDKLPSEALLTEEFSVSRTVIREAVASLRADRIVDSRRGSGVFVLAPIKAEHLPFRNVDPGKVSSILEILEVRMALESEAAALAAVRRSPAQEEEIIAAFREFRARAEAGEHTTETDFRLHLAIAKAANNSRFPEFLSLFGPEAIPRRTLRPDASESDLAKYRRELCDQHEAIVNAILEGNEEGARSSMRDHLRASQARYRSFLRRGI
ncbi:FadR/GntR family transcriptional regulator [Tropicimonas sp. IMCC6043]|uniref:FadR/GntR family transcriptional regulator n=1 Tax=Tropicimonas sp. IMCC6043 TaxID=2510645 RepID=UPI00101BAAC7|nr:FadR/GntR family transcriptional regulator [Tropicimonas sp. IMCC6043]RYH07051.1 FadR family transcriptional regulator [Tropicimonas sp. IMCC6043]